MFSYLLLSSFVKPFSQNCVSANAVGSAHSKQNLVSVAPTEMAIACSCAQLAVQLRHKPKINLSNILLNILQLPYDDFCMLVTYPPLIANHLLVVHIFPGSKDFLIVKGLLVSASPCCSS